MSAISAKDGAPGFARHVGRVGALALALGIGTAVAGTPGVAWADPTETATTSPTDTGTTTGGTADASEPTVPTTPSGATSDGKSPDATEPATSSPAVTSPSQSTVDLGDGVVLSSSGGAHTSSQASETSESVTKSTVDLGGGVALSSSGGALTSSESIASKLPEAAVTPTAPTDPAAQSSAPAAGPSGSTNTKSRHDGSRHQTAPVHPPPSAVVNRAPPAPKVTVSVGPGTGHQTAGSPGSPAVAVRPTPVVVNSLPSSLPAVQKAAAPPPSGHRNQLRRGPFPRCWAPCWRRVRIVPPTRRSCGRCWPRHGVSWVRTPGRSRCPTETCCAPTPIPLSPVETPSCPRTSSRSHSSERTPKSALSQAISTLLTGTPSRPEWYRAWAARPIYGTLTTSLTGVPFELQVSPDGRYIFTFIENDADAGTPTASWSSTARPTPHNLSPSPASRAVSP